MVTSWVLGSLIAILVAQIPLGLLVYWDATRQDLAKSEEYGLAVIVPAGGLIVLLWYLQARSDLPQVPEKSVR